MVVLGPKTQLKELGKGVDIIIGTPGRFLDLYLRGGIETKKIKTMVIDECDRMMDMGFMPQLRNILEVIPTKDKTFYSAPHSLKELKGCQKNFYCGLLKLKSALRLLQ